MVPGLTLALLQCDPSGEMWTPEPWSTENRAEKNACPLFPRLSRPMACAGFLPKLRRLPGDGSLNPEYIQPRGSCIRVYPGNETIRITLLITRSFGRFRFRLWLRTQILGLCHIKPPFLDGMGKKTCIATFAQLYERSPGNRHSISARPPTRIGLSQRMIRSWIRINNSTFRGYGSEFCC